MIDFVCQEVNDQGHTRAKIDLETWQRHHSRSLRSSSFLVCQLRTEFGMVDLDVFTDVGKMCTLLLLSD